MNLSKDIHTEPHITKVNGPARIGIWLLIIGIIFAASNLRAPITAVGPIIGDIREDTGISNTLAGMLTTLPLLSFAVFSILAPKIARRLGIEVTLMAAFILLTAGIILRSLPSIAALFIGTGLLGMAIAAGNVLVPSLIKKEFSNKVGVMTGIYSVSMNICGAFASGISIPIAQGAGLGWRGALGCWSILSFITLIIWLPQIRARRHSNVSKGISKVSLWRSGLAWKVTFFMGLQSMIFYVLAAWLPEILYEQGMSPSAAGWVLSLIQFATLPSSFIIPILAGRYSSQRGLVTITVSLMLIGFIGIMTGNTSLVPLFVILIGLAQGSLFSLATMFFVLRTRHVHESAELSGMAQSIGYLLAAIGPTLFGFIHDIAHNWTSALIMLVAAILLVFVFGIGAAANQYVSSPNISNELKKEA
ncbi:CP family cyanate transporter-like MFS transporter [Scopulibacillus daqui]|uniref:CP family cyanate transporter-like MFS transporter n=1 Tax=Scopulibacillus daqui TaxID=1469162 RepID=A0ABS2Q2Y6_9BACL|nr:MFS transporter [Scopulibacillus daqui]MBM7646663.1 CP family cyanate transporter-like MFS transporter [Scopulibacillus daqui]